MKKQTKKREKSQPKKEVKKVKAKKAKVVKQSEDEIELIENASSETEVPEQNQQAPLQLSMEDRRRLEFKFGARITSEDLMGTRAEVINKVSEKTEESEESLTVMLNDGDFAG